MIMHDIDCRPIFESAARGIFRLSRTGVVDFANLSLARMMGYDSPHDLIANLAEIRLQAQLGPALERTFVELLESRLSLQDFETLCRRGDGSMLWVSISVQTIVDHGAETQYALGIVENIEARKRAEEEVQRLNADLERRVEERTLELSAANRELEAFGHTLSHDLRAPLRLIDFFSRQLLDIPAVRVAPQAESHLNRVLDACQRMGRLINDMLRLARISTVEIRNERFDLSGLARDVMADLARAHPERRMEFMVADGLVLNGDHGLLRILLENLLGNAWKYTAKESVARIRVSAYTNGTRTTYFVRDNGVGFDMAHAQRLFTPFQRFHSAKEFEGSGIGLSTVRRIVDRHAGHVWIRSKVGVGTTVFWTLGAGK